MKGMPSATSGQRVVIDARRHAECGHPKAQSLATLEFLHCWRCGVDFNEGRLELRAPVLERDDPPGVIQNSSYMGSHWEEAAAQLVGAETSYPLAAEEEAQRELEVERSRSE